jgi:hypothetical protein
VGLDHAHYDDDGNGGVVRSGDPNGSFSVPGLKFGLRIGLEYAYTKNLTGHVLFQVTELGRMVSIPSAISTVNPSWFDLGVSYRF